MFLALICLIIVNILYRAIVRRETIGLSRFKARRVRKMYITFGFFTFLFLTTVLSLIISKKDTNVNIKEINIEELIVELKKGDLKSNADYVKSLEDLSKTYSKMVIKTTTYNENKHSYLKVTLGRRHLREYHNRKRITFK